MIQSAYSPSEQREAGVARCTDAADILRAARILHASAVHDQQGKGAFELDGKMIDVPVVKQASFLKRKADARLRKLSPSLALSV